MLYGRSLYLWRTQRMEIKLRASRTQGPRELPGTCFGGEHLYPKILVVPYKPWAARVTDIGLLVPLYSGRLGIKGTCTGIMSTQHPEHCDGKPGLCGQTVLR